MAGNSGNQFNPPSYLTPNQQDLLMAALVSNNSNRKSLPSNANTHGLPQTANSAWDINSQFGADGLDPLLYTPGQSDLPISSFDNIDDTLNDSPYPEFLDNDDANLDFDMYENADLMIGGLPDANPDDNGEDNHEKRKNPEGDFDDQDENDAKRRDPDEKAAKKPGRKPLTMEPTNVCVPRDPPLA